jgi:hypothetical protein
MNYFSACLINAHSTGPQMNSTTAMLASKQLACMIDISVQCCVPAYRQRSINHAPRCSAVRVVPRLLHHAPLGAVRGAKAPLHLPAGTTTTAAAPRRLSV